MPTPQMGAGELVTNDMEKAEVLVAFLASVFIGKAGRKESHTPESRGEVWNKVDLGGKGQVREHVNKLDVLKSMRPGRLHP